MLTTPFQVLTGVLDVFNVMPCTADRTSARVAGNPNENDAVPVSETGGWQLLVVTGPALTLGAVAKPCPS